MTNFYLLDKPIFSTVDIFTKNICHSTVRFSHFPSYVQFQVTNWQENKMKENKKPKRISASKFVKNISNKQLSETANNYWLCLTQSMEWVTTPSPLQCY